MSARIITPEHEAEIRRLHAEGLGSSRIGQALGINRSTINNVRMRLGLPGQPPAGAPKGNRNAAKHKPLTGEQEAWFRMLHNDGFGCNKLAECFNIGRGTSNRIRRQLGLIPHNRKNRA
jgi:hypothetical protein